jgi:hypothetical protein
VMEKIFEFLRTGRRNQLPVNVELPYEGILNTDRGQARGAWLKYR